MTGSMYFGAPGGTALGGKGKNYVNINLLDTNSTLGSGTYTFVLVNTNYATSPTAGFVFLNSAPLDPSGPTGSNIPIDSGAKRAWEQTAMSISR